MLAATGLPKCLSLIRGILMAEQKLTGGQLVLLLTRRKLLL